MIRRRLIAVSVLAVGAILVVACGSATAASIRVRITPTPKRGTPQTEFVIRFRAPVATGVLRNVRRQYELSFAGPVHAAGCVTEGSLGLPASRLHANVRVTLRPRRFGGARWCPGTLHGRVQLIETPRCGPREVCPALVLLLGTVGTFTVHVTPPGGDATPPRFAGLTSATACTPGPVHPGETTPANLRWSAASDNRTQAAQLVYDIFMATTSGAENFLRPTWTTKPGATSFRTPPVRTDAGYFVVRARDRAGNEDANTVERPLSNPCK